MAATSPSGDRWRQAGPPYSLGSCRRAREVAHALANQGCISYTRGTITILDRGKLHANACECYGLITQATIGAMKSTP